MNVPEIELLAQRKALTDMYRLSVNSAWTTIPAAWVCAAFAWTYVAHVTSIGWALAMSLIATYRHFGFRRRMSAPGFLSEPDSDARYHARMVLANSVAFAIGFVLFAITSPIEIVYGFVTLALAMAAGATLVFATHRPSFLCFSLPLLVVPVILLLYNGYLQHAIGTMILGAAGIVYAGILIAIYSYMHRIFLQNYHLQIEKDQLLDKLRLDNRELSTDREIYRAASLTDKLTNAPNRRHFDLVLKREWERAYREANPLACVMLDIDHFKEINDRFGHHTGDEYLRRIAWQLAQTLNRGTDFLARYGGEEFVVILPNTDLQGAWVIAEHLRQAIAALGLDNATPASACVTVSAGVSAQNPKTETGSAALLLEQADSALYRAKHAGRNQVVIAGAMH